MSLDLLPCQLDREILATAYAAASRSIHRLPRKDVYEADIVAMCEELLGFLASQSRPASNRYVLFITTELAYGIIVVYREQVQRFCDEVINYYIICRKKKQTEEATKKRKRGNLLRSITVPTKRKKTRRESEPSLNFQQDVEEAIAQPLIPDSDHTRPKLATEVNDIWQITLPEEIIIPHVEFESGTFGDEGEGGTISPISDKFNDAALDIVFPDTTPSVSTAFSTSHAIELYKEQDTIPHRAFDREPISFPASTPPSERNQPVQTKISKKQIFAQRVGLSKMRKNNMCFGNRKFVELADDDAYSPPRIIGIDDYFSNFLNDVVGEVGEVDKNVSAAFGELESDSTESSKTLKRKRISTGQHVTPPAVISERAMETEDMPIPICDVPLQPTEPIQRDEQQALEQSVVGSYTSNTSSFEQLKLQLLSADPAEIQFIKAFNAFTTSGLRSESVRLKNLHQFSSIERQILILKKVLQLSKETEKFTIDDLSDKGTLFDMALLFSELLSLSGRCYLILENKENSNEIGQIQRGPGLIAV